MILVVDVGNTHTVIGLYQGKKLSHHWRLLTEAERTADEYGVLLRSLFSASELVFSTVQGIVVSSVVPPMNNVMEELAYKYFRLSPLMVGPGITVTTT
jgi:type III pantothenate kinase